MKKLVICAALGAVVLFMMQMGRAGAQQPAAAGPGGPGGMGRGPLPIAGRRRALRTRSPSSD